MKKTTSKIISILVNLLLILSVCLVGTVVICSASEKVPSVFGYSILRVISGSMEPEIHVNDYILVKKTDIAELKTGDIISFYSKDPSIYNKPNTHRIDSINKGESLSFITKGTANEKADQYPVVQEDIIGKYVCKLSVLSFVFPLLSNPMIFFALILLPLILILSLNLMNQKNKKIQSDKTEE